MSIARPTLFRRRKIDGAANELRKKFAAEPLSGGNKVWSASQVAEYLHISVSSAHKAINLLVEDGVLYRVRGSGTYLRGNACRKLSIGILSEPCMPVPESMYKMYENQIRDMAEFLSQKEYTVRIVPYIELMQHDRALEALRQFDGLLVSCTYLDEYTDKLFRECTVPLVLFNMNYVINCQFSQICGDLSRGMSRALSWMTQEELASPVIIAENTSGSEEITRQWTRLLRSFGVQEKNIEIVTINYLRRAEECYRYVRVYESQLAHRMIFTTTDGLAVNIINAFVLAEYVPGKDFQLVSCGNREAEGFRFSDDPMITSIGVDRKKILRDAASMLKMIIENKSDSQYIDKIPSELIVRKTFIPKENKNG